MYIFVVYTLILRKLSVRRMGQPTQRATNDTARSNIEPAQIFLHANGQTPRSGGARRQRRGEPHTEHGLGFLQGALCA